MKFKGFSDWIEIFKGGKQTDSDGRTHDGDALIDTAIAGFDPSIHEPPVVVGHPKDNSPAFGWAEALKSGFRDGTKVLYAKIKDVVPEFRQAVEKGLYKKRSASFYPDGTLRHIGFLGAAAPAVKGLTDLRFTDDEAVVFEFTAPDAAKKEFKIGNFSTGGKTMNSFKEKIKKLLNYLGMDPEKIPDEAFPDKFPEDFQAMDPESVRKQIREEERKKLEAEFTEKERNGARSARDKETSDWVGAKVKEGKVLPSWANSGLVSFMQGLDAETEIAFAEGAEKKSALNYFKGLLEDLEKSPIFKEIALKGNRDDAAVFAEAEKDQELGESIAAKVNPQQPKN